MTPRPLLVICTAPQGSCIIQQLLARALELCSLEPTTSCRLGHSLREAPSIAARLLYADTRRDPHEAWIRVSGEHAALDALEKALRMQAGVSYQRLGETRHSMLLRLLVPRDPGCGDCTWCLSPPLPPAVMHRSTILTPDTIILELIAARRSAAEEIEERGCKILYSGPAEELEATLTPKQAHVLIEAVLQGYYETPRRVSLHRLAEKLGVTTAGLAELLRRAERTAVKSYVYEELPHLLLEKLAPKAREAPAARGREKGARRGREPRRAPQASG